MPECDRMREHREIVRSGNLRKTVSMFMDDVKHGEHAWRDGILKQCEVVNDVTVGEND